MVFAINNIEGEETSDSVTVYNKYIYMYVKTKKKVSIVREEMGMCKHLNNMRYIYVYIASQNNRCNRYSCNWFDHHCHF